MQLFLFLIILLFTVQAESATVTGVSGTVANGQTITVTGSSFGDNGPTVLLFDNFEGGTNNNTIAGGSSATVGTWSSRNGLAEDSYYSNLNSISGSLAARFDATYPFTDNPAIVAQAPSAFDSFYVSWWVLLPTGSVFPGTGHPDGLNWKLMWIGEGAFNDADVGIWSNGLSDWKIAGNGYPDNSFFSAPTLNMSIGTWYRFQMFNLGRTNATGQAFAWTTDSASGTVQRLNRSNVQTLGSGDSGKRLYISTNGYVLYTTPGNCYPTFDDVYMATGDYAQARVEIGNASTYATSTKLTMCTTPLGTSGWSDTSISCTVRDGGITGTAYVYVTDSNGNRSSGYQVTMGAGSSSTNTVTGGSFTGSRVN
jgi:hypothetical protein